MNVLCDLLILALFAICVYQGYKRGFVKTFFGFFGRVLALLLTSLAAKPVAGLLSDRIVYPLLKEKFLSSLSQQTGQEVSNLDFSNLPEVCQDVLSRFGTDSKALSDHILSIATQGVENVADAASAWVVKPLADSIAYSASFFALFFLLSLLFRILTKVLNLVTKVPGLNFSNRFLGILAGVLEGLLLCFLISVVLHLAEPAIQGSNLEFVRAFSLEKTYLVRFFVKFNPFAIP